ncbi:uncharacterized protein PHACADRAFT_252831 [Phanerochaete carnosa HHB-10118-sp]|uniref:Uncharacterized protein n=1 Tax=Phanerochaete carnosa (strain HHB-10118-sp) TaxID=650164 RepID=K5WGN1_PHACS|nr:uncharacterized protein PHACADRAFT_252831 [Phanerochaete carnosa HHB-10118-sp]EKM58480.1 hypothetical protein PHACADRAFT_252831 [Phanerochaete carnosa HHB-10118-sp]
MSISVLVSAFPPFPTLSISAPADTCFADLYDLLTERYQHLPRKDLSELDLLFTPHSGPIPSPETSVASLLDDVDSGLVTLRLIPRLRGGKGGFGSQLRAAGGRMSSQKTSNNDSCRDLSGRRLSTIKEAKKLAEYIESEPLRKQAEKEAKRAKLEALERKLGMDAKSSSGSSEPLAGKKHRLDDGEFLIEHQEIVDNVKSAVAAGLLKKKKKAKTAPSPPAAESTAQAVAVAVSSATTSAAATASTVADKVLNAPESAAVAVAVSAATGIAAA